MTYEAVIGLEVHVQLRTKSKMFCACSTRFGAPANTHVCPVCLGYPGAMPVMNEAAIRLTVLTGLMIGSAIQRKSKFDRKSYFYPDMPKNYQISQYDQPLCLGGKVPIQENERERVIGITRIHLEEDVAKSIHAQGASAVDFNRAGVPLMEIVSEPDLRSPDEAFVFLQSLKRMLQYIGVSDCNLEEGNMRCDVNCSLRPVGRETLGTKTELKNLNTFKGVHHALTYEIARQQAVLQEGGAVVQETRRWDVDSGRTYSMRSKEDAHDYRYFPEPDLMPVELTPEQIDVWRKALPELPRDKQQRFVEQYRLPDYDAGVLAADRQVADYFEAVTATCSSPKLASNWVMTEVLRYLAEQDAGLDAFPVPAARLGELIALLEKKVVNQPKAKEVLQVLIEEGGSPADIIQRKGWGQVSDESELVAWVEQVLVEHEKSVTDYRSGRQAALQFLMGQVMRLSRGNANPQLVSRMLRERLET